jgi:hypothetical protein
MQTNASAVTWTVLATAAVPFQTTYNMPYHLLEARFVGPVIEAEVISPWGSGVIATLMASHADASGPGQAAMALQMTDSATIDDALLVHSLTVAAIPSAVRQTRLGATDFYHSYFQLDAVNDRTVRFDGGSQFSAEVTSRMITTLPQASSNHKALVVLAAPLDGGPSNALLDAEVKVRERFTYYKS